MVRITDYQNIVVLTGAGVSVASGLRTYRGPGGMWTELGGDHVATPQAFAENPAATWTHFVEVREGALRAEPNAAHLVLAEAERKAPGSFTLITQNVDGLHRKAGSTNVVEVHGNIFRSRCPACENEPSDDLSLDIDPLPTCAACGSVLRPDVIMFGEHLGVDEEWATKQALRECDIFIAVGTSGTVAPASNYVRSADYAGARTVLINLEPMSPKNPYFHEEHLGRAEVLLPSLLDLS